MKKILIVITTAFVEFGGLTTVALNYYRFMDKTGMQIDFASTNEPDLSLTEELKKWGSRYYNLGRRSKIFFYRKNLQALIEKNRYDVIHIHSSVYFDYLLIDKPIGFTIDDYDQYLKKRGFIFDNALDYMPGTHIKDNSDFKAFIAETVHEQDNYRQERKRINDLSNTYHDGDERKRLLDYVGIEK